MFSRRNREIADEQLDRVGRSLVHAAAADGDAVEQAATSPFLYTRLRARLATEQAARSNVDESWLAILTVARRAVPALTALSAIVFALMFWLASSGSAPPAPSVNFNDEAFFDARETNAERAVLTDTNNLTRDDVLNIVFSREEQGRR
jgi:hypothetical protein